MQKVRFEPANIAAGLGHLIDSPSKQDGGLDAFRQRRKMPKHPFGLDLPKENDLVDTHWAFVGNGSDQSFKYLTATLRAKIGELGFDYQKEAIKRLRIFNVQHDPKERQQHNCYFEVWMLNGVLMSGDCTDCSATGGYYNKLTRSVFSLLSSVYSIAVEEFEITYEEVGSLNLQDLNLERAGKS